MQYQSTRNISLRVSAAEAIATGISAEGGLFVPECFPALDVSALIGKSYPERAAAVLKLYLTDFTEEEIENAVRAAYTGGRFEDECPAPVVPLNSAGEGAHLLELWHGPTCAFKDMALQLLPYLMTRSLEKTAAGETAVILTATSGDTGKAALEGFRDVPGTKIIVFYPENGVSAMQKRQMATQEGKNVSVCAIRGNFDDAQTGVKKIFTDEVTRKALAANGMRFSSANSINWGRLLPQIVYYYSAYADLVETGKINVGDEINVAVPTGNFGNILAAYYAKRMGLPVKTLICASNKNSVLTDFIRTGIYDKRREFFTTSSPSMDILVSSNLERLLFHLGGENAEKLSNWMQQLQTDGVYTVDGETKAAVQSLFAAGFCGEAETAQTISETFRKEGYLLDPHTAVAVHVYEAYRRETGDAAPTVIVSTASPYKFPGSVLEALEENQPADDFEKAERLSSLTETRIPAPIAALREKAVRFTKTVEADGMPAFVREAAGV